ncbi:hypothetical protein [Nocardioides yefusunii]|uniref:SAF domain-containing protein n=1 Tax=Nocardioides yefusunii TaxID=2500546 RepID=A0ABW1QSX2_9ACTN|nr:hypothetical protein [Nocardioides yefusunii]
MDSADGVPRGAAIMAAVVGTLEQVEMPRAAVAKRAGWRDPRLWVGVTLVAVSVVLGAQVVGSADDSVAVWAAGKDIARGDRLSPAALVQTRVRFTSDGDRDRYLVVADGSPGDVRLTRSVGVGELVPRAALGQTPDDVVQVSVSLPTVHVPPGVVAGSVVDVWVSPRNPSDTKPAAELLREVTVLSTDAGGQELVGASNERQVVLQVPDRAEDVARVVAASGADELVLVGRG